MTCDWDRSCDGQFLVQEVLEEDKELVRIKLIGAHKEAVEFGQGCLEV